MLHGLHAIEEGQALDRLGLDDGGAARVGQADDADLEGAHLLDDVGLDIVGQLAGGILHHVGGQEGELGLRGPLAQHLLAKVQVVVAHRRGVVAGDVHGVDDGGALGLVGAEGALPDVAGVQHQDLAAGVLAELVDVPGQVGQAAGLEGDRADLDHFGGQGAVKVVGVQDGDRLERGGGCRGGGPGGRGGRGRGHRRGRCRRRAGRGDQQHQDDGDEQQAAAHGASSSCERDCTTGQGACQGEGRYHARGARRVEDERREASYETQRRGRRRGTILTQRRRARGSSIAAPPLSCSLGFSWFLPLFPCVPRVPDSVVIVIFLSCVSCLSWSRSPYFSVSSVYSVVPLPRRP